MIPAIRACVNDTRLHWYGIGPAWSGDYYLFHERPPRLLTLPNRTRFNWTKIRLDGVVSVRHGHRRKWKCNRNQVRPRAGGEVVDYYNSRRQNLLPICLSLLAYPFSRVDQNFISYCPWPCSLFSIHSAASSFFTSTLARCAGEQNPAILIIRQPWRNEMPWNFRRYHYYIAMAACSARGELIRDFSRSSFQALLPTAVTLRSSILLGCCWFSASRWLCYYQPVSFTRLRMRYCWNVYIIVFFTTAAVRVCYIVFAYGKKISKS